MITISEIYKQTTDEQIVSYYLPAYIPNQKRNYKSPFSEKDEKPSLSFYKKGNKLMFKSHNTGHQGDVMQFVADLHGLNSKKEFNKVLEIINKDMHLNLNGGGSLSQKQNIKVTPKNFSTRALAYWRKFGVNQTTLVKYNVQEVKEHSFVNSDGKPCTFNYEAQNKLVFCYNIAKRIKIYMPSLPAGFNEEDFFQGQDKMFGFKDQNSSDVFGLAQLPAPPLAHIIFAAGEKDCLAINANGFHAIAMQSENQLPQNDLIDRLKKQTSKLYVCYDNDPAGINSAKKIQEVFGISSIKLPDGVKDAADYFTKFKSKDFKLLIEKSNAENSETEKNKDAKIQESKTIFHRVENYLKTKYDFRYNTIKHEIEVAHKSTNEYRPSNENSLYIELMKNGLNFSMPNLIAVLKSEFVPKYNPLQYYFENLKPWQKTDFDYIQKLSNYIDCGSDEDNAVFRKHFKKWLCRAVACALLPSFYNKQALILVHGQQNSGKSTFCRFLCPPALSDYIAEDITNDKDSRILLTKNFLINLDELSSLARKEINSLKSLFSKDKINERLPYDRKNSIIDRVCSFIGSTNMSEFLADETGSVRWLCFNIKSINWKYNTDIDINDVWAQAHSLYKSNEFEYALTSDEIKENEIRNHKFQLLTTEDELIPKYFRVPEKEYEGQFMTATDILLYLQAFTGNLKLNKIMIGKALVKNSFKRIKDSKTERYGFLVHHTMQ